MRARTSASQACGSMSFILAVYAERGIGTFMPPAELCRTGPVWRVVVTLASSIACAAAPFHSA
jgi:uncharacterized membrane protein YccC